MLRVPQAPDHVVQAARPWFALAVASLMGSGLLALSLVVGRAPGLHELFTDPLLFRRCLVVHVDLALVVWIHAFVMALYQLVPGRRLPRLARLGSETAGLGVMLLLAAACVPGTEPILSNYVPVIDHPLFAAGLVAFAVGAALGVAGGPLFPDVTAPRDAGEMPAASHVALRAAALMLVVADVSFAAATAVTSTDMHTQFYWELVAWGGGHVLQFSMMAGMMASWMHLVGTATGREPMTAERARVLFAALVLPTLAVPALALHGTSLQPYYDGSTLLMRWGIFPVTLVVLVSCLRTVHESSGRLSWRAWLTHPQLGPWMASVVLCVAGFLLGASIQGSNTRIPAHYHASIGAVTASCMAVTWWLGARMNVVLQPGRLRNAVRWQPLVFGAGQLVFALGFGVAGAPRKTYAGEQVVRTTAEWAGLGIMALGGLVAVAAGVLFLAAVSRAWLRPQQGEASWKTGSIPSSG